jgi:anaerobic C4-dicarboxylate transporter
MIRNLFYILAGGLSFWLPPVIAAYIVRHEPNVVILILAPLLSLLLTYRLLVVREQTDAGPSVAVLMIIGVFLLGPTLMYAQTTSYGAGFLTLHETTDWLMLILFTIFPCIP